MIQIRIAPEVLAAGRATEVTISVANCSPTHSVYDLAVEYELDDVIRLDRGTGRIAIEELRPGAIHEECRVSITGRWAGVGAISFPYVTYRMNAGPMRSNIAALSIKVVAGLDHGRPALRPLPIVPQESHLPSVFISHRHADSGWLGQFLRNRLISHLAESRIFLDHDDLTPGDLWRDRLERELSRADALLALIGPEWERLTDESGTRRLHLPDDVVRYEIATALRRRILVVPVLHDRAAPPRADELPHDLQPLLGHHCARVDHGTYRHAVRKIAVRLRAVGLC